MEITLNITKIQVIHDQGPDIVFVITTMPAPFPSGSLPLPLTMRFETKPGYGVSYVRQMFGIQPEVIDIRNQLGGGGPIDFVRDVRKG